MSMITKVTKMDFQPVLYGRGRFYYKSQRVVKNGMIMITKVAS